MVTIFNVRGKYFSRLFKYMKERFSFGQFILLSALITLSSGLYLQIYFDGLIVNINNIAISFIALFFFLFHLRIFDEFKDYEHDCLYYPHRPVPRDLISLSELKITMIFVILFEFFIATTFGGIVFVLFLLSFFYSWLMFYEFFMRQWLRDHFSVYIFTHEILLIPLLLYIFSFNKITWANLSSDFVWYLVFFLGSSLFLLEVARKLRPKELEIPSRDTYTAQYGVKGASFLVMILAGFILWSANILLNLINYDTKNIMIFGSMAIFTFFASNFFFIMNPNKSTAKFVFIHAILFVVLIICLFVFSLFF